MGGAGGHMPHPYDLDEVKSGIDLIKVLKSIPAHLAQEAVNATLKLDGSNNSVKIIDRRGKYEFALDRGAMGPGKGELDFRGVTPDDYEARGTNPGLQASTNILLGILNEALVVANIEPELKKLGLIDREGNADYSKFLNTEFYQSGAGNAIVYDVGSFIAFHGVYQFYEKWYRQGKPNEKQIRTGLPRPTYIDRKRDVERPIKDASRRIPYDNEALETLVRKIRPFAKKEGFKVFGPATARQKNEKMAKEVLKDMESTLSKPLTIQIDAERAETRTLQEWLSQALNPLQSEYTFTDAMGDTQTVYQPTITLADGSKKDVYHKDNIYRPLMVDGKAVVDLFAESNGSVNAKAAIDSAILFHATRLLGQDIKNHLSTEQFGDVMDHEGVVIRDLAPEDFKITGEFMVSGQAGAFAQRPPVPDEEYLEESEAEESLEIIEDEDEDPVVDSEFSAPKTVALVAGAFKPPHEGHIQMVKKYATKADEVVVLISNPLKKQRSIKVGGKERNITAKDSKKIWEILLRDLGLENIEVKISPKASPVQAVFEEVGKSSTLPQGTHVILGASSKPDISGIPDWQRYLDLVRNKEKHVRPDLVIEDLETNAVEPHVKPDGTAYSAGDFRDLLTACSVSGDLEGLTTFSGCPVKTQMILDILGIETKKPVDEASSMGGSNVTLGPLSTSDEDPPAKRDRKKKKPSMIRQENTDLSLVEEVLELIIGRGVYYE